VLLGKLVEKKEGEREQIRWIQSETIHPAQALASGPPDRVGQHDLYTHVSRGSLRVRADRQSIGEGSHGEFEGGAQLCSRSTNRYAVAINVLGAVLSFPTKEAGGVLAEAPESR
jgi:hypothetical protein